MMTAFSRSPVAVAAARAVSRLALRLGPLLALLVAGCATMHSGPPTVPFRITTGVTDATVWIDDHLVGKAAAFSKGGQRLPAGFHRIEVRAPGYYSYFQEVDGKAGIPVALDVTLHPLLD